MLWETFARERDIESVHELGYSSGDGGKRERQENEPRKWDMEERTQ